MSLMSSFCDSDTDAKKGRWGLRKEENEYLMNIFLQA
jgi:hypothetical protein